MADVVDRYDVRMIKPSGGFRLAKKALLKILDFCGSKPSIANRLDRDHALNKRIARLIDDSHRTPSEHPGDFVAT